MWKQTKVKSRFVHKKLTDLACSDCLHGESKICLDVCFQKDLAVEENKCGRVLVVFFPLFCNRGIFSDCVFICPIMELSADL